MSKYNQDFYGSDKLINKPQQFGRITREEPLSTHIPDSYVSQTSPQRINALNEALARRTRIRSGERQHSRSRANSTDKQTMIPQNLEFKQKMDQLEEENIAMNENVSGQLQNFRLDRIASPNVQRQRSPLRKFPQYYQVKSEIEKDSLGSYPGTSFVYRTEQNNYTDYQRRNLLNNSNSNSNIIDPCLNLNYYRNKQVSPRRSYIQESQQLSQQSTNISRSNVGSFLERSSRIATRPYIREQQQQSQSPLRQSQQQQSILLRSHQASPVRERSIFMEAYHKIEQQAPVFNKVKLGDDNLNNSIVSNSTRYSLLETSIKKNNNVNTTLFASPSRNRDTLSRTINQSVLL